MDVPLFVSKYKIDIVFQICLNGAVPKELACGLKKKIPLDYFSNFSAVCTF